MSGFGGKAEKRSILKNPVNPVYFCLMTKDDAAKRLGVSPRTLNRLQTMTEITPAYIKAKGGNYQLADYSEDQVEIMRRYMNGQPLDTDSRPPATAGNGSMALASLAGTEDATGAIVGRDSAANLALLAETIARAVEKALKTPRVELTDKMVLSLAEASKLSGIPPRKLKTAQFLGSPLFWKDSPSLGRGYRVIRMNLESYILGLAKQPKG